MNYNVLILSEAEHDIDNAFIWYELNQIGLGNRFYESVDKSVHFISERPFSFFEIYKGIRRFVIKKFPYGVYYKVNVENKEIQIIGVIHFKRSSKILRKEFKKKRCFGFSSFYFKFQLFTFNSRCSYFLNIKYTANTKNTNPIRWFILNDSVLKTTNENTTKTVSVITS